MSYKNLNEEARRGLTKEQTIDAMLEEVSQPGIIGGKSELSTDRMEAESKFYTKQRNDLRKKNLIADYPFFLAKTFFRWVPTHLDLVIYGIITVSAAIGAVGVYFDWLVL